MRDDLLGPRRGEPKAEAKAELTLCVTCIGIKTHK